METIVCCACHQRNRVSIDSAQRAKCGACGAPLDVLTTRVDSGLRSTSKAHLVRLDRADLTRDWGAAPEPVGAVYVLVDCSSSMAGSKLEESRLGALRYAEQALAARHAVGLVSFASDAKLCLTAINHIDAIRAAVGLLVAKGYTNLREGLAIAIDHLALESGRRSIVVVTDGKADEPNEALVEAERAKRMGISIAAVGTQDADQEFLAQLVSERQMHFQTTVAQLADTVASAALLLPARGEDTKQR